MNAPAIFASLVLANVACLFLTSEMVQTFRRRKAKAEFRQKFRVIRGGRA